MPLPETFGWYRHVIHDSRARIAQLEVAPAVVELSTIRPNIRKLVRKFGADVVFGEIGLGPGSDYSRYNDGVYGVVVVTRDYRFVKRVIKSELDESVLHSDRLKLLPFPIPGCRDTAVKIAESIATSLAEAAKASETGASCLSGDAHNIEDAYDLQLEYDDGRKLTYALSGDLGNIEDAHILQLESYGPKLKFSPTYREFAPTYLKQCLSGLEFTLSDGTALPELRVAVTPSFILRSREVRMDAVEVFARYMFANKMQVKRSDDQ